MMSKVNDTRLGMAGRAACSYFCIICMRGACGSDERFEERCFFTHWLNPHYSRTCSSSRKYCFSTANMLRCKANVQTGNPSFDVEHTKLRNHLDPEKLAVKCIYYLYYHHILPWTKCIKCGLICKEMGTTTCWYLPLQSLSNAFDLDQRGKTGWAGGEK